MWLTMWGPTRSLRRRRRALSPRDELLSTPYSSTVRRSFRSQCKRTSL